MTESVKAESGTVRVRVEMTVPNFTVAVILLRWAARRINMRGRQPFDLRYPQNGAVVGRVEFEDIKDVEKEEVPHA